MKLCRLLVEMHTGWSPATRGSSRPALCNSPHNSMVSIIGENTGMPTRSSAAAARHAASNRF